MSYKSILVHVDEAPRVAERIRLAVELALQDDGHLLGVAMTGIARALYQNAIVDEQDPNLALHLNFLRERANRALEQFGPLVQRLGLQDFAQRVVDDDPGAGLSVMARHADLVVIGQADPEHVSTSAGSDFPAQVLTHSGRPVLVVPYAGLPLPASAQGGPARRIMVAWNATRRPRARCAKRCRCCGAPSAWSSPCSMRTASARCMATRPARSCCNTWRATASRPKCCCASRSAPAC